jgi:DNA polymerase-3 subunit delta'
MHVRAILHLSSMQFQDVIGQEDIKHRLRKSIAEGRLAHALMLLGPEGAGCLPLALAFVQYIACPNKSETDSCGQCATCRKIDHLQFADLHFSFPFFNKHPSPHNNTCSDWLGEFRAALSEEPYLDVELWRSQITKDNKILQISVPEAGDIVKRLSLHSYEGGYKFQIIWMAEYLKSDTANKLLKIIEEPPPNTLFILIASATEQILPTIMSRVQVMRVPRLSDEDIHQALLQKGVESTKAEGISHYVYGDWLKANVLIENEHPDELYTFQFQDWMRKCYKKDVLGLVRWAEGMNDLSRDDKKYFLNYAMDQVRQNLIRNYTGDPLIRMNGMEKSFSDKFAPFINDLNAESMLDRLQLAYRDVDRNINTKILFTDLSFKLHYLLTTKA